MYELPSSLLYANAIDRYLINSAMLPGLKKDSDGGITIYLQHESPGTSSESNWLPAPRGPFWTTLRLYWPKPEALNGQWKQPPLRREQWRRDRVSWWLRGSRRSGAAAKAEPASADTR